MVESAASRICRLDELPNPGSRAFTLGAGDWPLRGFIVRQGDLVYAYVNRCPHAGHPLDSPAGHFLNREESLIQCSSHGAQFAISSGFCVAGPCAGKSLISLPVHVAAGLVVLDESPDSLARRFA